MSKRCLRFQVITLSVLSVHETPRSMQGREYSRAQSNTNRSAFSQTQPVCAHPNPQHARGRSWGPIIDVTRFWALVFRNAALRTFNLTPNQPLADGAERALKSPDYRWIWRQWWCSG